jgi:hypothetical protein
MQQFRLWDMHLPVSVLAALAVVAALCGPAAADALYPTVRLGNGDQPLGGGAAFAGTTTDLPGWLRWALSPQFQGGTTPLGAAGLPDRSYRGVAWTMPLADNILQRNDRLSFGFSLGNGFGDSLAGDGWRDLTTVHPTPTTRFGAAIGYQVTPSLGLFVMFDHVSVSGIAREDEISNDLGMRLGLRF